jgi:hypothetical protein
MRHFFASVAGESYRNDDGTSRQAIIQRCEVGELLALEHEPDNPHDVNAIRVLRRAGGQIGYLPREIAGEVISRAPKGWRYHAFVAGVGRARGVGPYGVALVIVVENDGVPDEAVHAYAAKVLEEEPPPEARVRRVVPSHRSARLRLALERDLSRADAGGPSVVFWLGLGVAILAALFVVTVVVS